MKSYLVNLRHLFISPGHNFFGRHGQPPGTHGCQDVPEVRCRAGQGLEGDRFFGYKPDYNGQVTFFSGAVYDQIKVALQVPGLRADAFRRNIVIDGVELNDLIGTRFHVGGIEFEGISEAKPCAWMDHAVAPGAEAWLRGKGGLRAKVLTDGTLKAGAAELRADGLLALA